ncbi:hypothetical protein BDV93DRAFT_511362 [Ceratobasidium sp. AG-I]|nr:hypothetical protein BDV93DRAFT_511362 [Ceratobasidium sp. AG-I]
MPHACNFRSSSHVPPRPLDLVAHNLRQIILRDPQALLLDQGKLHECQDQLGHQKDAGGRGLVRDVADHVLPLLDQSLRLRLEISRPAVGAGKHHSHPDHSAGLMRQWQTDLNRRIQGNWVIELEEKGDPEGWATKDDWGKNPGAWKAGYSGRTDEGEEPTLLGIGAGRVMVEAYFNSALSLTWARPRFCESPGLAREFKLLRPQWLETRSIISTSYNYALMVNNGKTGSADTFMSAKQVFQPGLLCHICTTTSSPKGLIPAALSKREYATKGGAEGRMGVPPNHGPDIHCQVWTNRLNHTTLQSLIIFISWFV